MPAHLVMPPRVTAPMAMLRSQDGSSGVWTGVVALPTVDIRRAIPHFTAVRYRVVRARRHSTFPGPEAGRPTTADEEIRLSAPAVYPVSDQLGRPTRYP
jgi:hypothetical protein